MIKIILFIGNFLVALMFGWDIMSYYFIGGINIINNDVNRVFIMWLGFIVTVISSFWFMDNYLKQTYKNTGEKQICDFCEDAYRVQLHCVCERCRKILGD